MSLLSDLRENMTPLSGYFFFSCHRLSAMTKFVTLAHTSFFRNRNSLRSAFKIRHLNQTFVLNRYHNHLSVGRDTKFLDFFILSPAFSHQDTRVFAS